MKSQSARLKVLVELALALLGVHVLILAVFRRYSFGPLFTAKDPTLALVVCFVLLGFRVWRNRGGVEPNRRLKEGLKPGNWLSRLGTPGLILVGFFLFVFFMFHHYGGRLGNDGVMNYIYVRSLVLDGDFNLTNEFEVFVPDKFQHIAEEARRLGKPPDPSNEPGPAFMWAPAFAATHGAVKVLRGLGGTIADDGYSYPYINAVCVSSLLWGFLAVVIAYWVARRYYEPHLAAVSLGVVWLSSTLYWYTVMEPSMPHATAAAAVSFFLFAWLRVRESPTASRWVALGFAAGLIVSMQRYNVFYFLAPLATAVGLVLGRFKSLDGKSLRKGLQTAGVVVAALIAAALPMLLYNLRYSREGSFLRMGDWADYTFRYWNEPRIDEFLFSSNHGLFSWTPVAYLAVLGLFLLFRKDKRLAATLLLTLAGGVYLLSSTWDWYAGFAFGSRRMTEAFLIFGLGFCGVVELCLRRPKILGVGAAGLLVAWNFLLAGQVKRGEVPMMGTFAFSEAASRAAKRTYEMTGHLPSAPASWLFARKHGVRPDQFDPIFGKRAYHNLILDVGGPEDEYFLGYGWSIPETLPGGDGLTYRWSVGEESSWLVTLFEPFVYRCGFIGESARHPQGRRQTVSIEVNGHRAGTLTLGVGRQTVETQVPASSWKAGLNEIKLRYGWTVEAGEVYGGDDERQVAVRVDTLGVLIAK